MIEYGISLVINDYKGKHPVEIRFLANDDNHANDLSNMLIPGNVFSLTDGYVGPYKVSDCENPKYILKS